MTRNLVLHSHRSHLKKFIYTSLGIKIVAHLYDVTKSRSKNLEQTIPFEHFGTRLLIEIQKRLHPTIPY